MAGERLDFELDHEIGIGAVTAHGGVPVVMEHFRSSGAAAIVDEAVSYKRRRRGLSAAAMVESLLTLWACGGEPCEDLDRLREDAGLSLLLGHGLPAAQTVRDFLERFAEPDLPLLGGGAAAAVPAEGRGLRGLERASRAIVADLQRRAPQAVATIDLDATIIASGKRAAKRAYDGRCGYQPVIALWAEQDVILADEFRDGNVSAASGNRRVIERALAALPEGVAAVHLRADSALYDHGLMVFLDQREVGFAISVPVSPGLKRRILGLAAAAWRFEREDGGAVRHWAALDYLPDGAFEQKEGVVRRLRYIAVRITAKQGRLFADGSEVKYFCVVTNRADPAGGDAGDLLRWHRGKAGTVEHAHHVLANELAARALPSQTFAANAAWFRLNVILYNLLSAFKRLGLSEEFHDIRPKRLRFLVLNTLARIVSHARERLLRCASAFARTALDRFRARIHAPPPVPA
jgi:hypothetical protein